MTDFLDVSDTAPRIAYVATAAQTLFTVPFEFLLEEHLEVYVDDVLQTLTTHYTVSGEANPGGGSITFVTPMVGAENVVILLNIPLELTTHIPPSGPLDIPSINFQFTLFVMMVKQVFDAIERGLIQPDSDVATMDRLPTAANRASKYLFFDASGDPTAVVSVTSSAAVDAFWVTVLQTSTAAAARAALGITNSDAYVGISNHIHLR